MVPTGAGWAYETSVRLFSRGGHDWSGNLPAVVEAMRMLPVTSVTLDGECTFSGQSARLK
jgi:bifunctional non-homologous end joining protein LigD